MLTGGQPPCEVMNPKRAASARHDARQAALLSAYPGFGCGATVKSFRHWQEMAAKHDIKIECWLTFPFGPSS